MIPAQSNLFADLRLTLDDAIDQTVASLIAYGADHRHWCIAWSGGKDSTALLTLVLWLIQIERVPRPETLTVYYADTRQELPPLAVAALAILEKLRGLNWVRVEVVRAPLDKRFLVYILGRGVPPPNNNTLRWCTRQIKVDPMAAAIAAWLEGLPGNVLMLTGVRQGESAARDARIILSCSKDGGECGQGWYQQVLPGAKGIRGRIATLAPLLHWRVCHVWDWLCYRASDDWPTGLVAEAYGGGGDEALEENARTGCTGCPLTSQDASLDRIVRKGRWAYLAPLKRLKPLYRELREPQHRLKKTGLNDDGSLATAKNRQRMGPLTFDARLYALDIVLAVQAEVNGEARRLGLPEVDLLNAEEEARIRELIAAGTWPNGWDGDEPTGDTPMDMIFDDGSVLPLLL